ncbi:hypothetical protein V1503_04920 [Bacillus sp. SCS-151]|uniref:hypothetical protein n=1 Tax=Nanhaiella sioensis TaxID=3115293 RepID=UPI00397B4499
MKEKGCKCRGVPPQLHGPPGKPGPQGQMGMQGQPGPQVEKIYLATNQLVGDSSFIGLGTAGGFINNNMSYQRMQSLQDSYLVLVIIPYWQGTL